MYFQTVKSVFAFVTTNSVFQGQQVSTLWNAMISLDSEIIFAHQSFKWKNNARNNAGVSCVVVGVAKGDEVRQKRIYAHSHTRLVNNISPYLVEGTNLVVEKERKPLSDIVLMTYGNYPGDGNQLTLSPEDKDKLLADYPEVKSIIRRLYGSQELIRGIERWCLWIKDSKLELANRIPFVAERIKKCKELRLASRDSGYNKLAVRPHQFRDVDEAKEHAIIIPIISSEKRPYIPVGLISDGGIINNSAFAIYDAEPYMFSIIASSMHLTWIKAVCGKLKTDYRYSNTLGYNTFPIPPLTEEQKQALDTHTWQIMEARETYPGKTLAWLYDAKAMPDNLLSAHKALDDTLEKIYIGRPFKDDTERLEHLFKRYADMTANNKEAGNA